jgi:hypothetical protein
MRQLASVPRTTFARVPAGPTEEVHEGSVAFRRISLALRIALVPFAALGALAAGLVYVILLPVCGVSSVMRDVLQACWGRVRGTRLRSNAALIGKY